VQIMLYFTSILLTGVLAGFLAWYAWRQRNLPGARPFAGLALCVCLLALSESLSMLSPSPAGALFWFNVRVIFTATIPVLFLVFALEYTGHRDWLTWRFLVFALIIPALTQVILWSNSLHGWWVKQEVGFHQSGLFWLVETSTRIPGLWFMVHSFYCLILMLTGIVVILVTAWNRRGLYRAQGLLLSAGALIALVVTLIPVFNLIPQTEFNPFTPGIGLSLLLTALAVFRFQFLKRLSAAQDGSRTRTLETQSQHPLAMFFLIYFVMVASIAAVAYLSYQNYERQFRQRMDDQLLAIANLKVTGLERWRAERMDDAESIHQNPAFATLVARFFENPTDTQAQAQIQDWLDSLRNPYNYDRVFLLDTAGRERISSPATPEPVAAHLTQEEANILSAGKVTFLDFHRDTEDSPIYLTLLVPIYTEQSNTPLGLLVLRIDPSVYLYPYIQEWPISSASSETLLVRREGTDVLFLNELRFQAGTALTLRVSLDNTQLPAVEAVIGREGIMEGVDYRRVPVLAAMHAVPDSPWFLVAKTDIAEVYAPLRERLWQTVIFFGALLATSSGGLLLVWRQQRVRYYRGQVEAAEALRLSEEKFRLAFNINPDSMAITRCADGLFVSANKTFEQIFGYSEVEIVGKTASENDIWKDPEDRKKVAEELQATGEVRNYGALFLTRNGEIYGLLFASIIEINGVPHNLYIIHDITEPKQVQEKLDEERILLRTLIDNIPDRIYVKDSHGRKIISNSADWHASGGKTMEDIIGKTDRDVYPPELAESYWAIDKAVIDSGIPSINREELGLDFQGNPIEVLTTKVPLRDGQGKVVGLVGIGRDITDRKQSEAQILAVQTELQQMLTEADQSRRSLLSILEDEQRAGMALRDSEEKLSSIIKQTVVGIVVIQDGERVFYNAKMYEMLGYTDEEYAGLDFISLIHPEDRSVAVDLFQQGPAGAESNLTQMRFLAKSGEIRWIETSSTRIHWEGQPAVQAFVHDITERLQAERVREALYTISQAAVTENLEDLYLSIHRALGNLMPVDNFYIALYDPDVDLLSYPYSVDQHDAAYPPRKPGRGLTEYVLRTGRPLLVDRQAFIPLVQQGEVELVGSDSVEWLGVPLKVGEKIFGVIAVQSYTESVRFSHADMEVLEFVSAQVTTVIERKLALQRIADALELNNTLIDSSSLGISAYNVSGQCILANKAIASILGATREQVLGQNYNSIESWKKSELLEAAREAVASGNETRREIHTITDYGKEVWLDCHFTPFVSNGEPHLLRTDEDISIAKQAEIALQANATKLEQSNRDLQEFAYIASHDLQEPLRKVLAFSDLIISEYGDAVDETGRDYMKRMDSACQRMMTLITDLLSFARVETRARPFIEVDLKTVAQEAISDLENQIKSTQGRIEIGNLPMIEADPTQMHQLLQNLINNALKFRHEGCSPLVKVSAEINGDTCQISVADNGIGFNTQYLDRIFKPFERLHSREEYEGSGMGLAICRRIVERHGGRITATSNPGKGSTFIVTLPIHQSKGEGSHG
jgi:PAS domain S-box-containing protein